MMSGSEYVNVCPWSLKTGARTMQSSTSPCQIPRWQFRKKILFVYKVCDGKVSIIKDRYVTNCPASTDRDRGGAKLYAKFLNGKGVVSTGETWPSPDGLRHSPRRPRSSVPMSSALSGIFWASVPSHIWSQLRTSLQDSLSVSQPGSPKAGWHHPELLPPPTPSPSSKSYLDRIKPST